MIAVVAFAIAGALWLWVLVSTIRARDERRSTRVATFVGLALVVPAVAVAYLIVVR